jgi:hypothetical protein
MRWHSDLAFDARRWAPALEEFPDACVNLITGRGRQRHLGLAGTEGDFERVCEAAGRQADASSRKLEPV